MPDITPSWLTPFEWYESLETAEEAIAPLLSVLVVALIDAGYEREYLHEATDAAWPVVERRLAEYDANNE